MEYIQYEFIYIEYIMNLNTRFWIKRMAIYVIFLITFQLVAYILKLS